MYACGSDHTHEPDVGGVFVAGVFDDFGGCVAERKMILSLGEWRSFSLRKGGSRVGNGWGLACQNQR